MANGQYSASAYIARASDQAARLKQQEQPKPEPQKQQGTGATAQPTEVKPIDISGVFQPSTDAGLNWDYKTAKTDMQGNPLESRNFLGRVITPKSFDPNGNPYFGEGLGGWLNKWAYKISEESATKGEAQQAWQTFAETSNIFSANVTNPLSKNATPEEKQARAAQQGSLFLQGASQLWDASTKWMESQDEGFQNGSLTGGFKTPITYALRAVNAAVGMTLEAFQFVSEAPEKIAGAQRGMREYATNAGSVLPELTFDPISTDSAYYDRINNDPKLKSMYAPDNGFKANKEAADWLSRLVLPFMSAYDTVRFITSPGDVESKKQAVQNGWIEGRMLYTEILKDSVRQEYISRAKAGEDPGLLAMELEDPWIEMGGEMLLDPLNILGMVGKAKKAGQMLEEAGRVVENSGLLSKPEFIDTIKNFQNMNEVDAAAEQKKIVQMISEEASSQARRLASAQEYKASSYLPSSNKIRHQRIIGNHISAITQAIRNAGGTADDVLDYVNAIRKFASGDELQIMDGMATIKQMPVQFLAYNDSAFEVGYMLNNIMSEGDIVNDIQKMGGNFQDIAKYFDGKIQKAMDYAFPSVVEMQRAENKLNELKKIGEVADENTQRLAEALKTLRKEHPGYVKWAQFQDIAESALRPINGFLAHNYFSLSYGYAFRNFTQNMITLWVDGGLMLNKESALKFTAEGVSTPGLDEIIKSIHGGELPDMFKMEKTAIADMTRGSLGERFFGKLNSWGYSPAKLSQAAEVYASKMIYVKKYRETMDNIFTLGGVLPELSKWQEVGVTAEQANDFIDIFRSNNYDMPKAVENWSRKYGSGAVDKWRMLDWVNPEAKKGLMEYGSYWDEIQKLVNSPENPSQQQVLDFIDDLKIRVRKDANKVVDEPVRLSALDGKDPFVKMVMDDSSEAGKYANADTDNALMAQKLQAQRSLDAFEDAFNEAMYSLKGTGTPEAQASYQKMMDAKNSIRAERDAVGRLAEETRQWVIDMRNKVLKGVNPADIWDEAILGKKPKSGIITKELFLQNLWQEYYFPKRAEIWTEFFNTKISKYMEFANENENLAPLFQKANLEGIRFEQYRNYVYSNGKIYAKPPSLNPAVLGEAGNASNVRSIANAYGISTVTENGAGKDQMVLNIINKYGGGEYARLEDVPPNIAEQAFAKQTGQNPKYFMKKVGDSFEPNNLLEGLPVPPPRDPNVSPAGHVFTETKDGALNALTHIQQGIRERWGLKAAVNSDANVLYQVVPDLNERIAIAKSKSQVIAEKFRDFALLPYGEKTNLDFAMGLAYPYQFWYSRSYKNWMQRAFMTNPELISRYANLKEALASEQKGLPDWWKSQLNVSKLLGIQTDNPIYINLEAAVNPLYGLTGTDFNNPKKRVDWWTATLDDMGKFGPSVWAPLQIATAAYLSAKGEKDVAAQWGSRLIPQTATVKAVSSYFGKPVELDPAIWLFNGGMDTYEEGRVNRALSAMASEGIPEEALIEAARTHQGDLWDEAYRRAINERALGQISSFLFGVGFKGRSQNDVEIDRFYSDYERMKNLHKGGYMTDDQYRQAFNVMRQTYPFMDVVLLSRRAGDGREAAYAYNVMSRIPPGQSSAILEAAGVDPETAQKFYDSGGDFGNMTETERQHFYASMVDIGALLAIPSNTTRDEWTAVRARYNEITNLQKQQYGDDILDRIQDYYALKTSEERAQYADANPDVMDAMEFKTSVIANDSVMVRYYGGIDTIERYYTSQMYDKLDEKYSDETLAKVQMYYEIQLSSDRTKFKKQNPDVAAYFKDKYAMQDDIARQLSNFGDILPATPELQPGVKPSYSKQEDIYNAAQPQPKYSQEQWTGMVGQPVMDLISEFKNGDKALPYQVRTYLEKAASQYGYDNENDMLVAIMSSMP